MNIDYLIQLLSNKLIVLNNAKIQAFNSGDLPSLNSLDEEILGVQDTLSKLKLLLTIDAAALAANTTTTNVVTTGIGAISSQTQGPSASAIINGYDISAYATDVLYEQKIKNILSALPLLSLTEEIDNYIKQLSPESPVTGDMVLEAASAYNVDLPLLLAIMQNDSAFGTLGVGARTYNPGNVGNTGTAERSYPSWLDGVMAVAQWLNNHRQENQLSSEASVN